MEIETIHWEELFSRDMQPADICCTDIMSAKLSNEECLPNPVRVEFHAQETPLKCPELLLTNLHMQREICQETC